MGSVAVEMEVEGRHWEFLSQEEEGRFGGK